MDVTAFRNRVRGILMQPDATFKSDGQPTPPWSVVAREHVFPLIIGSTVVSALMQLVFLPATVSPFDIMLLIIVLRLVTNIVLVFAMAYVAARLSAAWGGRGDLDAGFVLIGLATTPMFLAEAVAPFPVLGWLLVIAAFVYTFVLVFRGSPICLGIPDERRGLMVLALIGVNLLAGAILLALLGGIFGVDVQMPG
ncbi:MAG: Yip1 family protein [Pseudomonadota bacterium]